MMDEAGTGGGTAVRDRVGDSVGVEDVGDSTWGLGYSDELTCRYRGTSPDI